MVVAPVARQGGYALHVPAVKDHEMSRGEEDYNVCEFYEEKPVAPERNK
jgi:hypothetical protein